MIRIRNLTKTYGDNAVLRGVDLDAAKGEFVVVLGESGAGKSTLLRCVNRLAVADGGELNVDGMDAVRCADTRALRQRVAMIFQHHNVVPRLSALKNVLTGRLGAVSTLASVLHLFSRDDIALAHECLGRVGLAHKAHERTDSLSGGQMQRVAIARALVNDPPIILADEPTGNLDSATGALVMETFHKLQKRGKTIVLITHDPGIAAEGDSAVTIRDGRIHDGAYIPHAPRTLRSAVDSLPMISASANAPKGVVA